MNLPRILVAGVGNIFLGDDAFGIQVVQRLRQRALPDNVRLEDFGTHDFDLARAMSDGFDVTIIVDALRLGDEPGTLYLVTPDPNEYDELEEDEMETDDRDAIQELRLFSALTNGTVRSLTVDILDSVLLVMITMEIFYTVTLSLKSHTLVAEPFLIVGAIAAVRRVLVITATTVKPEGNPEAVTWALVELGLLALVIISISFSVYILRKGQQYPAEKD